MLKIDLPGLFKKSICTFAAAQKAAEHGFTCANTYYAYDERGEVTNGGWLQDVAGCKMYPAINIALAIGILEDTDVIKYWDGVAIYLSNGMYYFKCDVFNAQNENLCDLLIDVWINFKTK